MLLIEALEILSSKPNIVIRNADVPVVVYRLGNNSNVYMCDTRFGMAIPTVVDSAQHILLGGSGYYINESEITYGHNDIFSDRYIVQVKNYAPNYYLWYVYDMEKKRNLLGCYAGCYFDTLLEEEVLILTGMPGGIL